MCYSYLRKQTAQKESVDRNATTAATSDRIAPATEASAQSGDSLGEPAYESLLSGLKSLLANPARRRKEHVS
jgi:hypothetical protein